MKKIVFLLLFLGVHSSFTMHNLRIRNQKAEQLKRKIPKRRSQKKAEPTVCDVVTASSAPLSLLIFWYLYLNCVDCL